MEKDLKNPVWFKWPSWARWIATDSNGMTFIYEDRPIADLDKMGWSRAKTEEGQIGRIEYVYRDIAVEDWKMTLKENPNKEIPLHWQAAPEWARWIARNENNKVEYFEEVPLQGDGGWISYGKRTKALREFDFKVNEVWKNTLEQNPNYKQLVHIEIEALDQIEKLNAKIEQLEKEIVELKKKVFGGDENSNIKTIVHVTSNDVLLINNAAPEWATHHAFDKSGKGHYFSANPLKGDDEWLTFTHQMKERSPFIKSSGLYWQDSVIKLYTKGQLNHLKIPTTK